MLLLTRLACAKLVVASSSIGSELISFWIHIINFYSSTTKNQLRRILEMCITTWRWPKHTRTSKTRKNYLTYDETSHSPQPDRNLLFVFAACIQGASVKGFIHTNRRRSGHQTRKGGANLDELLVLQKRSEENDGQVQLDHRRSAYNACVARQ